MVHEGLDVDTAREARQRFEVDVDQLGAKLTKLSPKQAGYIGVKVEGPWVTYQRRLPLKELRLLGER